MVNENEEIMSPEPSRFNGTFLVCVSDQEESEIALRYACLRAKRLGAKVALLHIQEPADFQSLMAVTDVIRHEKEEEAQTLLNRMADIAQQFCGQTPMLILREGRLEDEIVKAITEQKDVAMVVFGLRHDSLRGPKIASKLTAQLGNNLLVPLVLIPGNLSKEQIEALA